MCIIIKSLPKSLCIDALENHLKTLLAPKLFRKAGELKNLKLLQLVDKNNNKIERYAIACFDTASTQKRIIKHINNHSFEKAYTSIDNDEMFDFARITASPFIVRCYMNDKRAHSNVLATEKRTLNRRRNLNITPLGSPL